MANQDWFKRLAWSGMLAVTGTVASVAAHRMAGVLWRRVFDEEPPE